MRCTRGLGTPVRAFLLWVAVCLMANGQDAWNSACGGVVAKSMQYPEGVLTGDVSARFGLDEAGRVVGLRTSGESILAKAVTDAIAVTDFPKVCNGREAMVDATFGMYGDRAKVSQEGRFIRLNREWIVSWDARRGRTAERRASREIVTAKGGLGPVTVCELLADPAKFNGMAVLLLGRNSASMEGHWVSEDRCERELRSGAYRWPNMASVEYSAASEAPATGLVVVDPDALASKLEALRKRTTLGFHEQTLIRGDGRGVITRQVQDDWTLIYGIVRARAVLRGRSSQPGVDRDWGNGFGHLNAAPVAIESRGGLQYLIGAP